MFPFWYGDYPYQVAEYDECPTDGRWDSPQAMVDPEPQERWSKRSMIWRPWVSEDMDVFSIFRVCVFTHFPPVEMTVAMRGGQAGSSYLESKKFKWM